MTSSALHLLLGAVLAAACNGRQATPSSEPTPSESGATNSRDGAAPARACSDRAADLEAWIDALVAEGTSWDVPVVSEVVGVSPDDVRVSPLGDAGTVVQVTRDTVAANGSVVASGPGVGTGAGGTYLVELSELLARERCQGSLRVLVAVAPDAPWALVRQAVEAVYRAGGDRVAFVVRIPTAIQAPPPRPEIEARIAEVEAKIAATDPSKALATGAPPFAGHPLETAFGACDDAVDALPSLAGPAKNWRKMAALVEQCACRIEPDDARHIVWWWSGRRDGVVEVATDVVLHAPGGAPRAPLVLPDGATWQDTHARVFDAAAAGKPLAFVRKGAPVTTRPAPACP